MPSWNSCVGGGGKDRRRRKSTIGSELKKKDFLNSIWTPQEKGWLGRKMEKKDEFLNNQSHSNFVQKYVRTSILLHAHLCLCLYLHLSKIHFPPKCISAHPVTQCSPTPSPADRQIKKKKTRVRQQTCNITHPGSVLGGPTVYGRYSTALLYDILVEGKT